MSFLVTGTGPRLRTIRLSLGGLLLMGCAACQPMAEFALFQPKQDESAPAQTGAVKLVERDVEAPDVFQITEPGLWDGRPSLGGVWVAHPDVKDPERVIIRNTQNGSFVIGALFRRERNSPGPAVQVSSDAAATLGMLAGQPQTLNITALRREEVPDPAATAPLESPPAVGETTLGPIASAAAAIDAAEAGAAPAPTPQPAARPKASGLEKPYLQIGIFSVEQNARNTAQAMRTAGMVPIVKAQSGGGKPFWRVLVGPATTAGERATLLRAIKEIGFTDAYPVTN